MFVRSRDHFQFQGDPAARSSSRREFQFRHRARQLTEAAASTWYTKSEREYLLDQAEIFRRVADQIAPPLPSKFFG